MCLLWLGCETKSTRSFRGETLVVACGMCIFKMEGLRGCLWTAEIDGRHYLVDGKVPQDHDAHGPVGMCNLPRKAVVTGELTGGRLVAEQFTLLPPPALPDHHAPTPAHQH